MTQDSMRLRLVIRRNGLPEDRIVFPVGLESEPTISTLLEQVNELFPLESSHWGLEDYAVEVRGNHGTAFELLHYQQVHKVLKDDEQVIIRSLSTDDVRRRRVSGRHQISVDGKHLIDGVAFGRPMLKALRGRPGLDIPPRKRCRVASDSEVEEYSRDAENEREEAEDLPLLTNGENRRSRKRVKFGPALEQDMDSEDDDVDDDYQPGEEEDDFSSESDQEDALVEPVKLARNAQALKSNGTGSVSDAGNISQQNPAQTSTSSPEKTTAVQYDASKPISSARMLNQIGGLRAAFPKAPTTLIDMALKVYGENTKGAFLTLSGAFAPALSESAVLAWDHAENASSQAKTKPTAQECLTKGPSNGEEAGSDDDEPVDSVPEFIREYDHKGLPPGTISSYAKRSTSLAAAGANPGSLERSATSTPAKGSEQPTGEGPPKQGPTVRISDDDDTSSSGTSSSGTSSEFESGSDGEEEKEKEKEKDEDEEEEEEEDEEENEKDEKEDEEEDGNEDEDEDEENSSSEDDSSGDSGSSSDSGEDASGENSKPKGASSGGHASGDDGSSSEESNAAPEEMSARGAVPAQNGRPVQKGMDARAKDGVDEGSSTGTSDSEDDSSDAARANPSNASIAASFRTPATSGARASEKVGSQLGNQPQASSVESHQRSVAPGNGTASTRKRNARRRKKRMAGRQARDSGTAETSATDMSQPVARSASEEKADFEARREALLAALSDSGVEVGPNSSANIKGTLAISQQSHKQADDNAGTRNGKAAAGSDGADTQEPGVSEVTQKDVPASTGTLSLEPKRRRLDVEAGRRMVLGALGLRKPKGKEDEDTLRSKLMQDIRPHQNARLNVPPAKVTGASDAGADASESVPKSPNAWRDRITYRAVECCQEGIELSEPPFPFVQRWDPQQQVVWPRQTNMRGGGSKRSQRNEAHFYQDSGRRSKKRNLGHFVNGVEGEYASTLDGTGQDTYDADNTELNYDDAVMEDQQSKRHTAGATSTEEADAEDLPPVPAALTILPHLRSGEAQPGMVITWKQFILSKATNWQPQLSDLTGIVTRIDDHVTGICILLARRDRKLDRTEKQYDRETGERVYGKFEAPDLDEDEMHDDDAEGDGYRMLTYAELIEPRIMIMPESKEDTQEAHIPQVEDDHDMAVDPDPSCRGQQDYSGQRGEDGKPDEVDGQGQPDIASGSNMRNFEEPVESPGATAPENTAAALITCAQKSNPPAVRNTGMGIHRETGPGDASEMLDMVNDRTCPEAIFLDRSEVFGKETARHLSDSPSQQIHDELTSQDVDSSLCQNVSPETTALDGTTGSDHPRLGSRIEFGEITEAELITSTPGLRRRELSVSASGVSIGRQSGNPLDTENMDGNALQPTTDGLGSNDNHGLPNGVVPDIAKARPTGNSSISSFDGPAGPGAPDFTPVTPMKPKSGQMKDAIVERHTASPTSASMSSLASLNTVWHTAPTSRKAQMQSPSKTRLTLIAPSRQSAADKEADAVYQAAIRRLDGDLSDGQENGISPAGNMLSIKFESIEQSSVAPEFLNGSDDDIAYSDGHRHPLGVRAVTNKVLSPSGTPGGNTAELSRVKKSAVAKRSYVAAGQLRQASTGSPLLQDSCQMEPVLVSSGSEAEPAFVEHYADDVEDDDWSPRVSRPLRAPRRVRSDSQ